MKQRKFLAALLAGTMVLASFSTVSADTTENVSDTMNETGSAGVQQDEDGTATGSEDGMETVTQMGYASSYSGTMEDQSISDFLGNMMDGTAESISVSGDFDITFTFHNDGDIMMSATRWSNYCILIRDEGYDYLYFRADDWSWLYEYNIANTYYCDNTAEDGSVIDWYTYSDYDGDWSEWTEAMSAVNGGSDCMVQLTRIGTLITAVMEGGGATFTITVDTDIIGENVEIYLTGEQCELTSIEYYLECPDSTDDEEVTESFSEGDSEDVSTDSGSSGSSSTTASSSGTMSDQSINVFMENIVDGTAESIAVSGDFDITLNFHNDGNRDKADYYYTNYSILIRDEDYNDMWFRADNWSWLYEYDTGLTYNCDNTTFYGPAIDWYTHTDYDGDWSAWLDAMSAANGGSDCTVHLTRTGTLITAVMEGGGATFTISADTDIIGENAEIYLTGERCKLTNITYTINGNAEDLSTAADAAVTLAADTYTYSGSAKTPAVTVTCGGETLVKGTDYTVAYSNNTNAGTATVTITGIGDYTGALTKNFTINKASQTITVSASSVTLAVDKTSTPKVSGNKTTVSYSSSNTSVAKVSSSGKITAKKVGTATITVTAKATTNYNKATKTITVKVKPAATTISSVKNISGGVKITWKKVTGATGYYVYRATSASGTYKKIATIKSGSTLTYTNKTSGTYKVSSGKTYYYKVYAYASTGTSSASSAKSIRYLTAGKVSSATNASSGVTIKWSKVTGASGYYIYRKAGSGSYKKIATVSKSSTSYTNKTSGTYKVANGTTYTYYVIPYYKSSSGTITKGSYSATKKTVFLSVSKISSLKNSSSKKMTVKWAKNSSATGYQIQYSTSSSFASSKTKTVKITSKATVSKVIESLTKGKTYYVRVRNYKKSGSTTYYSAWSKKSVKISK